MRGPGRMIRNLFFGLCLAVILLSDMVIWLRVRRTPPKEKPGQLFAAIVFLLVAAIMAGVWILF